MSTITVLYPRSEGGTFDVDYYEKTHLPLVDRHWRAHGLKSASALRGVPGPDGSEAPYYAIALLEFESADRIKAALGSAGAAEVMGDVANFTNVRPILQFNERMG